MRLKLNILKKRDVGKWGKELVDYNSLLDFLENFEPKTAIHTVWIQGYPIDILMDYQPNKPVVFIWKGNTRRNEATKLPVFVGFSMVLAADATRISISDPTMYFNEQLGLAWYAGSPNIRFQEIISKIVEKIGKSISNKKIIHTGGSGGGFAALFFSKFNKNSLAIPFNPQTDFLEYEPTAVKLFLKSIGQGGEIEDAKLSLGDYITHNLIDNYAGFNTNNTILYLQNINDTHVVGHLKPFLESLGEHLDESLGLHVYKESNISVYISNKWGGNHNPPPKEFLSSMFKDILNEKRDFIDIIQDNTLLNKWDI